MSRRGGLARSRSQHRRASAGCRIATRRGGGVMATAAPPGGHRRWINHLRESILNIHRSVDK